MAHLEGMAFTMIKCSVSINGQQVASSQTSAQILFHSYGKRSPLYVWLIEIWVQAWI